MDNQIKNWLIKYPSGVQTPKMSLICFPFAGGGTVNYARWRADLSEEIDLYAFNLPGRERFFSQPCLTDYHELIVNISTLIAKISNTPLVFFGHSFGGLTAYFTALELKKRNQIGPKHVFISARIPPSVEHQLKIADLDDEEFLATLIKRYQGIPKEILSNPELMSIFIPIIRQDFKLYEQYPELLTFYNEKPLNCGLTTLGFAEDSPKEELFYGWKKYTLGPYEHVQLPGGHFVCSDN